MLWDGSAACGADCGGGSVIVGTGRVEVARLAVVSDRIRYAWKIQRRVRAGFGNRPAPFLSISPIIWLSVQVHYRHNPDMVVNDSVEDTIWKFIGEATSCFGVNCCPCKRIRAYSLNRRINLF